MKTTTKKYIKRTLLILFLIIFYFSFDPSPTFTTHELKKVDSSFTDSIVVSIFDFAFQIESNDTIDNPDISLNQRFEKEKIYSYRKGVYENRDLINGLIFNHTDTLTSEFLEHDITYTLTFFLEKSQSPSQLTIDFGGEKLSLKKSYQTNEFAEYSTQFTSSQNQSTLSIYLADSGKIFFAKPLITRRVNRAPNRLLWVVIDAMRTDLFEERFETLAPTLHQLAKENQFYKKTVIASNWTRPSTIAFLTGKEVQKISKTYYTHLNRVDSAAAAYFYQNTKAAIPELMSRKHIETIGYVNNPFLENPEAGYDLGFSYLYAYSENNEDEGILSSEYIRYMNAHPNRDIFAFINTNTMHTRYRSDFWNYFKAYYSEPNYPPTSRQKYYGTGGTADEMMSYLVESLNELSIFDDMKLIIHSDHGENLQGDEPYYYADNKKLHFRKHGRYQMPTVFHVPLILKGFHTTEDINRRVSTIDLAPTLRDIYQLPAVDKYDGWSLYETNPNRQYNLAGDFQFGVVYQDKYYEGGGDRVNQFTDDLQRPLDVTIYNEELRKENKALYVENAMFLNRFVITNSSVFQNETVDSIFQFTDKNNDHFTVYEISRFPAKLFFADSILFSPKHAELIHSASLNHFTSKQFIHFQVEGHMTSAAKKIVYTQIDIRDAKSPKGSEFSKDFEKQMREWGYIQ